MTHQRFLTASALVCMLGVFSLQATPAKNAILMIADGSGYNTWVAASMYQGRFDSSNRTFRQVFGGPAWQKIFTSTYPLATDGSPTKTGKQRTNLVYDPKKAWQKAVPPKKGYPAYENLEKGATDSAASATAMATGQKTYNAAINWSDMDAPMTTLAEISKQQCKSVGILTSVPLCHATPAALGGGHNRSRNNYEELSAEMLTSPVIDVWMGAGNPDYDEDGNYAPSRSYKYVGSSKLWAEQVTGKGTNGWTVIQDRSEFQKLAQGPTPARVLGAAKIAETTPPQGTTNLPTLSEMVSGALNVLDNNPKGFYMMVEGGAVDWANHKHDAARMVKEMTAYFEAVETVCRYLDNNTAGNNWSNTIVVLTADHDNGQIWGPDSDRLPFQPLEDRGAGKVPGLRYNGRSHSNALVPLFARGAGAAMFIKEFKGTDPVFGPYVDDTDIFKVMRAAMGMGK
jgi:alkaline phosphatase